MRGGRKVRMFSRFSVVYIAARRGMSVAMERVRRRVKGRSISADAADSAAFPRLFVVFGVADWVAVE